VVRFPGPPILFLPEPRGANGSPGDAQVAQSFTYSWQHREVLRYRDGAAVVFAYGSQFARRGVCPDDAVYIVSVHRGRVHLLSKMLVRLVTHSADDFRRYAGLDSEPEAKEYLLAAAYTPARRVPLPAEIARSLRLFRGQKLVGLAFRGEDLVDRQSLRSLRRLSAESAAALDALLPPLQPFRPGAGSPTALQATEADGPGTPALVGASPAPAEEVK
jgi:hypothetical protein